MSERSVSPSRGSSTVRWYRRISLKLAVALGIVVFAVQFLASMLIIESYRSTIEDTPSRAGSTTYAEYLSGRLRLDEQGRWAPTAEALEVVETFLNVGESYLWLDAQDRVVNAGKSMVQYVHEGDHWELCDSPVYCEVLLADGTVRAGSTWSKLAIRGQPIGTFVLVWFSDPAMTALWGQRQLQAEILLRLVASALVATLTSLLLVSIVTRRLSKLSTDASTTTGDDAAGEDIPGPFDVQGDDEIARLATALNAMRSRIENLVARLRERDRQRREWVAMFSHDLRTPLTALSVCLDRAREMVAAGESGDGRGKVLDALQVARHDASRLHTLVDGLFELARLDAGEELLLEPVPPGELVRQVVRGLGPMAEEEGVQLRAKVTPALPTVKADGGRLMRALENMVRNAVHFAREQVQVGVSCVDNMLRFEVLDDGPGLPVREGKVVLGKVVLERPGDQPGRPDSAGLGLIVTRRVATAHGGDIGGANRPEGGAAVWITIPIINVD